VATPLPVDAEKEVDESRRQSPVESWSRWCLRKKNYWHVKYLAVDASNSGRYCRSK
jgi:hypothetical protein